MSPRIPICPHGQLVEECEWCSPSRVMAQAPPHILRALGAEDVSSQPPADERSE